MPLLLALIGLIVSATLGWATTFYVDVNRGKDSFPGTESEPFRTIRRASQAVGPGDKVLIHVGIYHEQIMGGKSGIEGSPIIYEGVDREKVILRGSVVVKDWIKVGSNWMRGRPKPVSDSNVFVMVDQDRKLNRVQSPVGLAEGSFHVSSEGIYTIRLWKDANPNTDHEVTVYDLNLAFNAGQRYGGTAKKHIILRNMTIQEYGSYGVSAGPSPTMEENSHWEIDRVTFRYNQAGIFCCLDDWSVHDCLFQRNMIHGCQINGARVRFLNNVSKENGWFGRSNYGEVGLLVGGGNDAAHSCVVANNTFENNGAPDGYGCAIYLEGRSHNNVVKDNLIIGGTHAGIGFYGSSYNQVFNNVLINTAPKNSWDLCAAFVIGHSREGAPTQSVGNLIAHNTVWGCPAPVAIEEPNRTVETGEMNRVVNNLFCNCRLMGKAPLAGAALLDHNGWFQCPQGAKSAEDALKTWMTDVAKGAKGIPLMKLDASARVGTDAMLEDPSKGDYRLKRGSPAVDAGAQLETVMPDRDGNSRPVGALPDLGAYEYSGR